MGTVGDSSEFHHQQRLQLHDRLTTRRSDEVVFDSLVHANVPKQPRPAREPVFEPFVQRATGSILAHC